MAMSESDDTAHELIVAMWGVLDGAPPESQGAALASVVGMWLCQHEAKEGYDTAEVREELLGLIVHLVREYVREAAAL